MMLTTLNITSNAVRYLVARGAGIVDWGNLSLPGVMRNGTILDPKATGERIKSLFASKKLPGERVICSFNGLPFSYRLIPLPRMAQPALAEAVARAARKEMPLSLDDMCLSWRAYPDGGEEWECLVMGVAPPPLDALIKTLSVAGIRPCVLDIKHLLLSELTDRRDAIIVDFEPDYSHITLVAGGIPAGMHTVPSLGAPARLGDEIAALLDELVKMLGFYNGSHPENPLPETAGVLLTGELSADPSVAESIQSEIGCPVERLVSPLDIPADLPVSEYAANIGAVLKSIAPERTSSGAPPFLGINLGKVVSGRKAAQKTGGIVKKLLLPVALAAGIGLLATAFWFQHQSQASVTQLQAELNQANQEMTQSLALLEQSARVEGDIAALTASAGVLLQNNRAILTPEEYVSDLSQLVLAMPDYMSFDSVDMRMNQVVVRGTTAGPSSVVQFARDLEASGVFQQADIMWIKKTSDSAGAPDSGISFMVVIDK